MNSSKWSKSDIDWLIQNYWELGFQKCAKKLNRTISSIKSKVCLYRLYRDPEKVSSIKTGTALRRWKDMSKEMQEFICKRRDAGSRKYFKNQIKNRTGKKRINFYGYVMIKDYSNLNKTGRNEVLEHVKVMSEYLGRPVKQKKEKIHHIDMIKTNNDIKNLYLCKTVKEHQIAHMSINVLIKPLLDRNLMKFDKKKGVYILGTKWKKIMKVK